VRGRFLRHWAPGILRTQAFRIVLIYVFVFAVSATLLVGFTYWHTERSLDAQTDQIIEAEITGLVEQYQRLGIMGLAQAVAGRSTHEGQDLYLLADSQGRFLAGNLDQWPRSVTRANLFAEFEYDRRVQGQLATKRARGMALLLAGGFELLVARDVAERDLTRRLLTTTLPWSVGLMLLFGLIGGALISRNVLARLDSINRTSAEIVAGNFSHRVPLTAAHDEFDMLAENLNRMFERIERLMKGMREVARGALTQIDLSAVVADVAELYAPLAEEKNIALAVLPAGILTIEGNRSLISQALANLIDNAIKYTPAEGRVTIFAGETPSGVDLAVADSGPGIPLADRAHVVERFVRLEASRNSPGPGLGLSLVAAVARLHQARLTLDDNNPGLKATISFPRAPLRPAKRASREQRIASSE
jgi:signal transduction histidine kinase